MPFFMLDRFIDDNGDNDDGDDNDYEKYAVNANHQTCSAPWVTGDLRRGSCENAGQKYKYKYK